VLERVLQLRIQQVPRKVHIRGIFHDLGNDN
jgi:hypothetical protein